ncbi:MAG: hypothetical protein K0B08_04945 [Bacteroidales bacterium]|nr:hypothetical protein [Bacteroidales bacterium]
MKTALQNTGIIFLAALLIMTTGGFSVYEHFCRCAGEKTASIFVEAPCHHDDESLAVSCCMTEEHACFSTNHTEKSCHNDNYCQTTETYLKISDDFNYQFDKISLKFIVSFVQILTGNSLMAVEQDYTFPVQEFNDIPPPLYGRELVNHLHQLKTDHCLI